MPYRYSTALSYLVLAGTGGYCLNVYRGRMGCSELPCYTFGLITLHSVLGVWKWGNPQYGNDVDSLYKFTLLLQNWFALPCVTCQLWLNHGYTRGISYLHILPPMYVVLMYLLKKSVSDFYETFITLTMFSLAIVGFLQNNFYGVATAVSYAINYFVIREEGLSGFEDVPIIDLYNYGLCFYTYFSLKTFYT